MAASFFAMNITLSSDAPANIAVDVLAIGVGSKQPLKDPTVQRLDRALSGALIQYMKDEDWKAKEGQTLRLLGRGRLKAKRLLLVGLGEDESVSPRVARLLAVEAGRMVSAKGATLAVLAPN